MSDRGDVAGRADVPPYGSVGPDDPNADPVTDPNLQPLPTGAADAPTVPQERPRERTVFSGLYIGLVLAAVVLIFLLIFIIQNNVPVVITFLGFTGTLPSGVALLLSAVAGALLVAIPGSGRILQLRRAARRGK